jgi:hypothetical protein
MNNKKSYFWQDFSFLATESYSSLENVNCEKMEASADQKSDLQETSPSDDENMNFKNSMSSK